MKQTQKEVRLKAAPRNYAFAWLSLLYLIGECYHHYLNFNVLKMKYNDSNFSQSDLPDLAIKLHLTLVPSMMIVIYAVVLCFFKD